MFSKFRKFTLSGAKRGFTIIELLVVIAIIALLAILVLTRLNAARVKARDATRKANLREMQSALELYADNNQQKYPSCNTDWCNASVLLGDVAKNFLNPEYMSGVPDDPVSNDRQYLYLTNSVAAGGGAVDTRYCLTASLEDANQGNLNVASWTAQAGQNCQAGTVPVTCNYYVCN